MWGDTLVPCKVVYKYREQCKKWLGTLAVTQCVQGLSTHHGSKYIWHSTWRGSKLFFKHFDLPFGPGLWVFSPLGWPLGFNLFDNSVGPVTIDLFAPKNDLFFFQFMMLPRIRFFSGAALSHNVNEFLGPVGSITYADLCWSIRTYRTQISGIDPYADQ